MIKSVTVINHLNEKLKLELKRPEKSGFAVTKIEGLGPVKADIHTVEVSTRDGSSYNSARTNQRNIVIYLKFLFQNSIENVRYKSYRYFPVKKPISLIIETDNRTLGIDGYVEQNEPDIFSNSEGAQISIICPDPNFYSAGKNGSNTVTFYGIEPVFEFPFSNESVNYSVLEFGSIEKQTIRNVYYTGDVDTGIVITMRATGDVENVTIYNTETRKSMKIDTDKLEVATGSKIIAGDEITICTLKGYKSATLLRGGVYTNILNCLSKNTDWFQLTKGDNMFAYVAEQGGVNLQFKVTYNVLYEGV
jgi:phage-related protein